MNTRKSKEIKTSIGTVTVKKLPIGQYAEILQVVEELPKHLVSFGDLKEDQIISKLPAIIGKCLPEIIKILSIALDKPEEEIEQNLGLDEVIELIVEIAKINNYSKIWEQLKKAMAQRSQTTKA